jgi:hypothetical protein
LQREIDAGQLLLGDPWMAWSRAGLLLLVHLPIFHLAI